MWESRFSKQHNRVYYYNSVTKKTVWEKPEDYDRPASSGQASRAESKNDEQRTRNNDGPARKRPRVENAREEEKSSNPSVSGSRGDITAILAHPQNQLSFPSFPTQHPHSTENKWTRSDLQVNPHLVRTYQEEKVTDRTGAIHTFKDCVDPLEGRHLYNIVHENRFTNTLEVGLAMGASAIWIAQAHFNLNRGGSHVSIDPINRINIDPLACTI